ncbi:uncharacterized protein [Dysidea avara]|uniref:uncharacterized protein n=1 Tax=Dysidea avara TaxID=196820 RepID=UPI00332C9F4D
MMSLNRYLSVNGRQNSLSSIYSNSMESLSSSYGAADSYWSIDQELTQTSTAYTIPRLRTKTSDYDTGFSATEFDEEKKHIHSRKSGRIRKAFSFNRSKKVTSVAKETPPHGTDAADLMARLSLLEKQVRLMGEELHKERKYREELEQKVEDLHSENEQLKSERKVAGEQLQKFCKKFFDSVNSIPAHLIHNGLSTSSLNRSSLSMRTSVSSMRTSVSSMTSQ